LGLSKKGDKVVGKVDPKKLFEKTRALTRGVDLVKMRGLNNPPPDELERKYLIEKPQVIDKEDLPEKPEMGKAVNKKKKR
jgi:hypothetical protein